VISVLIPAAGDGWRLGADRPKALVPVAGRPMLLWSLDALAGVSGVAEILIAAPEAHLEAFEALRRGWVSSARTEVRSSVVAGGVTRAASVFRLLEHAAETRVMVHDAARPCIRTGWVEALLRELGAARAGVPALPVGDTMKRGAGGVVTETVPREGIYAVQTPQLFDRETLVHAHRTAGEARSEATDDAQLVEAVGVEVKLLAGDARNIKVTLADDIDVAAVFLGMEPKQGARG